MGEGKGRIRMGEGEEGRIRMGGGGEGEDRDGGGGEGGREAAATELLVSDLALGKNKNKSNSPHSLINC